MSHRGKLWAAIFLVAAIVRVLTLSAYPLHDTTEARYAEIARLMLVSGDWITPQIESGIPFWGKPPLSFWLTASSFQLFGLNEFAARLPAFLLLLVVISLIYSFVKRSCSIDTALGAAAILLTSAIGFVASGAVMTDAPLLLGTTLSMVAFWNAAVEGEKRWCYLFFVGIAVGLLAKGPVALILTAIPIVLWLLFNRNVWRSLQLLPWIRGFFVMAIMAAPWYVLAELKTPGFLEYFLVGEHWLRYVESGWAGDLYGSAHAQSRGAIWVFGIVAALPWSLLALYAAGRFWQARMTTGSFSPLQTYFLLWTLTPLFVFTFAGNILPAYILPGMPAFAILLSGWLAHRNKRILHVAWIVPIVIVASLSMNLIDVISDKSQKDLLAHHTALGTSETITYYPALPSSAEFYSHGSALEIRTDAGLVEFLRSPGTGFLAIRITKLALVPIDVESCLRLEARFARYLLFEKLDTGCHQTDDHVLAVSDVR